MINDFNYLSPEEEGVDSKDILELLSFMDRININVYSFLLARNGNIIAEGYYKPMDENFKHKCIDKNLKRVEKYYKKARNRIRRKKEKY